MQIINATTTHLVRLSAACKDAYLARMVSSCASSEENLLA